VQLPAPAVPALPIPSLHIIIAHTAVLSVALERVIEILKGILPFWPFTGARSRLRSAALIIVTAAIGTGFCWLFRLNLLHVAHVRSGYIAVGLAAAAGAAFWNNLLGLMRASRILKETQAASGK
jgi:hypothetical protein